MKRAIIVILAIIMISATDPLIFTVPFVVTNGYTVGTVKASDPDGGQTLSYKIISSNTNKLFAINASTGVITVTNAAWLNKHYNKYYVLIVMVTDSGGRDKNGKFIKLSAQATIHIYWKK